MPDRPIYPGSPPEGKALTDLLQELVDLQALVVGVAGGTQEAKTGAGAAANTNIALAQLTSANFTRAYVIDGTTGEITDRTAEATVTAGNIKFATLDTTGDTVVVYHDFVA